VRDAGLGVAEPSWRERALSDAESDAEEDE
jgi:hypothetical protein